MPSFSPLQLADTVLAGLQLLVILAGGVLAIVSWRRQPRVALFAVLGLGALLIGFLIWFVEIFALPALPLETLQTVTTVSSVFTTLARVAGFALLLVALMQRRQVIDGAEVRR